MNEISRDRERLYTTSSLLHPTPFACDVLQNKRKYDFFKAYSPRSLFAAFNVMIETKQTSRMVLALMALLGLRQSIKTNKRRPSYGGFWRAFVINVFVLTFFYDVRNTFLGIGDKEKTQVD